MANITDSSGNALGVGCLTLFGLPFALSGIGMGIWVVSLYYTAFAVRGWEEVPLHILEASVESHRGDDSTTYSVSARYRYEVNGRSYTGTRVYLDESSDSFRSTHQQKVDELESHRKRGEPIIGHYDPDNPADAILYREPRMLSFALMLLFPGIFTPVGVGFIGAAFYGGALLREVTRRKQQYPDEPWKWEPIWDRGEISTNSKPLTQFWFAVTILWLVMTAPLFFFAAEYLLQGEFMAALPAAPHLLIDFGLIYFTVRTAGRTRRYGKATLTLEPMPAKRGGPLSISLRTEGALPQQDDLSVTVRCERVRRVKRGKETKTIRDELWSDEIMVPANLVAHRGAGSEVTFATRIPTDLPDASSEDASNKVEWTLTAICETAGYDFSQKFSLPVFGVYEQSDMDAGAAAATVQAEPLRLDPKVVDVTETASGGLTFHFPRGRFLGASVMMLVFVTIFGGATVALILADGAPVIMPFAFGGTTLLIFLITIQMLTGSVHTTIEHGEMRVRRVVLLIPSNKRFNQNEIESITTQNGMRVNERQFYDIAVKLNTGKTTKAGTSIPGSHQAEQIATLMTEALRQ